MDFEGCSDDLSFYGSDSSSEEDSDSSCDDELLNKLNPSFTKALNLPKRSVDLEMGSKRILPRVRHLT